MTIVPSEAGLPGGPSNLPAAIAADFLATCGWVARIDVGFDGVILDANDVTRAILRVLGAGPAPTGRPVAEVLTPPDAARVAQMLAERPASCAVVLNLVDTSDEPHTLTGRLYSVADRVVVLAHEAIDADNRVQRELVLLNNELAVAWREVVQGKARLEAANAALEHALAELKNSHWHIRKVKDLLPICMECGRVKPGSHDWLDVVEYLRRNSGFLSHGYCPECAVKLYGEDAADPAAPD
jgi:hypothetical protein